MDSSDHKVHLPYKHDIIPIQKAPIISRVVGIPKMIRIVCKAGGGGGNIDSHQVLGLIFLEKIIEKIPYFSSASVMTGVSSADCPGICILTLL